MTLAAGDLTTPERVAAWMANTPASTAVLPQLITSMTAMLYGKLNRARLYNQVFTRVFDGVGNMQLVLPDWPVTAISQVQMGSQIVPAAPLPQPGTTVAASPTYGYGWRFAPWLGNLPGDPAVLELTGGAFWTGVQNIKVTYSAGYLISNEAQTVPSVSPYTVTVNQFQGIWCRDNGVTYADGTALSPVTSNPGAGQYVIPPDTTPGVYTFSAADEGKSLLISYSFIPADLEEACIQMVAERYSYRQRIGEISKSLGGQETVRFMRGNSGKPWSGTSSLPPEVMDLIWPYVSVTPPAIGAPV